MDKKKLRKILVRHYAYGTLDWVEQGEDILGVVRYNIDGETAYIIDLVIKDGQRGLKMMKFFIARGWSRFPGLKYLEFDRGFKYKGREMKKYKMKDFFKRKRS